MGLGFAGHDTGQVHAPGNDDETPPPTIALAMGDPAGISPELTARLLALDELRSAARLVVFGDRRVLDAGAAVAGVELSLDTFTTRTTSPRIVSGPFSSI